MNYHAELCICKHRCSCPTSQLIMSILGVKKCRLGTMLLHSHHQAMMADINAPIAIVVVMLSQPRDPRSSCAKVAAIIIIIIIPTLRSILSTIEATVIKHRSYHESMWHNFRQSNNYSNYYVIFPIVNWKPQACLVRLQLVDGLAHILCRLKSADVSDESELLPRGSIVVPFWGSCLECYRVIPKRN